MVVRNEVIKYLKNPDIKIFTFESFLIKLSVFIRSFVLCLLIIFSLWIVTAVVRILGQIEFRRYDMLLLYFWAINILVVPLLEETAFRLPLIYNRGNFSLSVLVISYIIISYSTKTSFIEVEGVFLRLGISGVIVVVFYSILGRKSIENKLSLFWVNNRKIIFYLLLLAFTLRHVDGFILTASTLILLPILLLPQLVSGIFLSFVRIRFGFTYSVLFHTMINFVALLPKIISYYVNS